MLEPLPSRAARLLRLESETTDVVVIGGGITGIGIAHDLALRGVRVALFEKGDWAGATSSASSRLIHGGLRYLEQYEFSLVRESCLERGLLLRNAAGIVWPERFTYPVRKGDRVGRAKLAAGLALYTLVSIPRALGLPELVSKSAVQARIPGVLAEGLKGGGSYLDGATDDARLAVAVVASAIETGATALSRMEVTGLEDGESGVEVAVTDVLSGESHRLRARAAVLAGGPFTDHLRGRCGLGGSWVSPTRGSHILVPRERLPTDGAVITSSAVDGRVMFLIPWPRYTVVGTTDLDADPEEEVVATRLEVQYLLDSANALVPAAGLSEADVVATWAGLRPLLKAPEADPSARSREERIEREGNVYTIAGGKLTAYRAMAETMGARIAGELGIGLSAAKSPTRSTRLRGALPRPVLRPQWSSLDPNGKPNFPREAMAVAWPRRYAGLVTAVEDVCARAEGGRSPIDAETLLGEVDWAVRYEDCLGAEDFYYRRTDLGLGPREDAEAASGAVLDRLASLCGWSPGRRAEEEASLAASLARTHGWRQERASSHA